MAKLKLEQVFEIIQLFQHGKSNVEIAAMYNVTVSNISAILNKRGWKNIWDKYDAAKVEFSSQKRIPPEIKESAINDYVNGNESVSKVARRYKLSGRYLSQLITKSGHEVVHRPHIYSKEFMDTVIMDYVNGNENIIKVARKHKVPDEKLSKWVVDAGYCLQTLGHKRLWENRSDRIPDNIRQSAILDYVNGGTLSAISEKYKISRPTLANYVIQAGHKIRFKIEEDVKRAAIFEYLQSGETLTWIAQKHEVSRTALRGWIKAMPSEEKKAIDEQIAAIKAAKESEPMSGSEPVRTRHRVTLYGTCGIYKITSPSGKVYIGQSINIEKRWSYHRGYDRHKRKIRCPLYGSFKKYGVDKHTFEILCQCPPEKLNEFEIYYIKLYNCISPNGLNLMEGGSESNHSEESRRKLSQSLKRAHRDGKFKPISEETKNKISATLKEKGIKPTVRFDPTGKRSLTKSKKIIDTSNGKTYIGLKAVLDEYPQFNYLQLSRMLRGYLKNKTSFIYTEDQPAQWQAAA